MRTLENREATTCSGYALSDDGSTVLLRFDTADGQFTLTLPVEQVAHVAGVLYALRRRIEAAGAQAGMVPMNVPGSVNVGHSDQMRGKVAICFDPGTENEQLFALSDAAALMVAEMLRKDVQGRMDPADAAARRLAGSASPTLIVPATPLVK